MGHDWSSLIYGRIVPTVLLLPVLAVGQISPLPGTPFLPTNLPPMCKGAEVGIGISRSCFENQHGFCTHQWATVFDNKWESIADLQDRDEGTEWCGIDYPENVVIDCDENKVPTAVHTPMWDFAECYQANFCHDCKPFHIQHQVYYCCGDIAWKGWIPRGRTIGMEA